VAYPGIQHWAVELREDGSFAGRAGLYHAVGWPAPEVNWSIRPDLRSRGLATEAGAAALEFAATLGLERVIAVIHPENAASIRVAEKLGGLFTEIATVGAWVDYAVHSFSAGPRRPLPAPTGERPARERAGRQRWSDL